MREVAAFTVDTFGCFAVGAEAGFLVKTVDGIDIPGFLTIGLTLGLPEHSLFITLTPDLCVGGSEA